MAKAKRSVRRDPPPITSRRLSDARPGLPSVSPSRPVGLSPYRPKPHPYPWPKPVDPITDGRVFNPSRPKRAAIEFSGRPARVVAPPVPQRRLAPSSPVPGPSFFSTPSRLLFDQPKRVVLCVRRKVRREVILAGGYGGRQRRGKRNQFSKVRC